MSLIAISQLPLKARAFALLYSPLADPDTPSVRALIKSVNVPEAGHWGESAQQLVALDRETSAAKRRKKPPQLRPREEWTADVGLLLPLLEMEMAADLADAARQECDDDDDEGRDD